MTSAREVLCMAAVYNGEVKTCLVEVISFKDSIIAAHIYILEGRLRRLSN